MNINWGIDLGVIDNAEDFADIETLDKAFIIDEIMKGRLDEAINENQSIIFVGKRGSGKTMLLKKAIQKLEESFENKRIIPVAITFKAWSELYQFPSIGEYKDSSKELTKELFKAYFFTIIVRNLFEEIKELKIKSSLHKITIYDKELDLNNGNAFEFMDSILKGLKSDIIPKRIISESGNETEKEGGLSLIAKIKLRYRSSKKKAQEEYEFSKMYNSEFFIEAIEDICKVYSLKKIIFYFDEIIGLGELQSIFFDLLYLFRGNKWIRYKIFNYPIFSDYGKFFLPEEDARKKNLDRILYKPDKNQSYTYFKNLILKRLEIFKSDFKEIRLEDFIDDEILKILLLCSGGNPRKFLNLLIKTANSEGKISIQSINDVLNDYVKASFEDILAINASRAKINLDQCQKLLNFFCDELKSRNSKDKSKYNTNIIGIAKEIYDEIKPIIGLLDFCDIIQEIDIGKVLGGSTIGNRYYLNPAFGASRKIFKTIRGGRNQLYLESKVGEGIYNELARGISDDYKITIGKAIEQKLDFEDLKKSLTIERYETAKEISIKNLKISDLLKKKLLDADIKTAQKIIEIGLEGLKKIYGIGDVRARNIYSIAIEEISDTQSALVSSFF